MQRLSLERKLRALLKDPKILIIQLLGFISPVLSDKLFLKLLFPLKLRYKLNLENPQTFNEKLQWLKLYYRNPELPKMVDKYEVKGYITKLIGDDCIIPTLGVWDSFDQIDMDKLPNKFVLKTTHDQGGVVVCKDKHTFDVEYAKNKLTKHLKRSLYSKTREWPYKNVRPRIIAEQFMSDDKLGELRDYKFFCFNGQPKILYVASDRQNKNEGVKFNYFDLDFKPLSIIQAYERNIAFIEKPFGFNLMVEYAKKLSKNLPHVRVDFYEINKRVYFGELTFFHHSGLVPFYPKSWDYILGSYIILPR